MSPSVAPPIAAVASVSDRRRRTMRRVLGDGADKARLSRSPTHLRRGSFGAINAVRGRPRQLRIDIPAMPCPDASTPKTRDLA